MSKELKREQVEMLPVHEIGDFFKIGEILSQSGMLGIKNPADGFIVATTCHQTGMSYMEFGETYNLIQGTPSMKADAMLARFMELGGEYEILSRTEKKAAIKGTFGKANGTFDFSWEDAQKEPFVFTKGSTTEFKKNWATPRGRKQMLWARVVSDMVRTVCPMANKGSYTPEEVIDFDDRPTIAVEPVETVVDSSTVKISAGSVSVEKPKDTSKKTTRGKDWSPPNLSVTAKPEEKEPVKALKKSAEDAASAIAASRRDAAPVVADEENPFTGDEPDPTICPCGEGIAGKKWDELDKHILEYAVDPENWEKLQELNPGKLTDAHLAEVKKALEARKLTDAHLAEVKKALEAK